MIRPFMRSLGVSHRRTDEFLIERSSRMSRSGWLAALVFSFMVAASGVALAQEGGGGGGGQDGGRGGRGGRGNFDPAQARERMMQFYKENLAASDEDWKVIQPKLEK